MNYLHTLMNLLERASFEHDPETGRSYFCNGGTATITETGQFISNVCHELLSGFSDKTLKNQFRITNQLVRAFGRNPFQEINNVLPISEGLSRALGENNSRHRTRRLALLSLESMEGMEEIPSKFYI
jgi:hypothetical protein